MIALFAAVAVRLALRIRSATRARPPRPRARARRGVLPLRGLRRGVRRPAARARLAVLEVSVWLLTLAVPLTAVAFLVGLVRWWVFIARGRRSGSRRGCASTPAPRICGAPSPRRSTTLALEIVYWLGNGTGDWGDADGHAVAPPAAAPGRAVTEIADERPPGRGDRPRRGAGGRSRLRRHGDLVRRDDAREPPARGADVVAAARGARVALAHPGRRGRRAPADRARPARRRAAAARRPAHQARAGRRADGRRARERRRRRRRAAPARRRRRGRPGGGPLARARDLPGVARRSRARRGPARGGAPQRASDHGPGRRHPAPLARGRERRVLLLPGGAPERGEARRGRDRRR